MDEDAEEATIPITNKPHYFVEYNKNINQFDTKETISEVQTEMPFTNENIIAFNGILPSFTPLSPSKEHESGMKM